MPKSIEDLNRLLSDEPKPTSQEEENKKARANAMRLLEHMDRTERGLYEKLKTAEFSEHAIADAVAYVKSFCYINDLRYAEAYLRTRVESKSRQQLIMELMRKGVDRHTIDLAWDEVVQLEEPDERALIRDFVLKKADPDTALDVKEMRRLYGQLQRKGFKGGDISSVLNELNITCDYSASFE
ncbi:MAG: regulatory protein RecX [Clostridiales bacterium]|nr:regulatory protein RecX [Candidatus Blautia equi]